MQGTINRTHSDAASETYGSVQKWLYKICWDFKRKYGGDFQDLMGDANLAYLHALPKWDPQQASFPTYLRMIVFESLFAKFRKDSSRSKSLPRSYVDLNTQADYRSTFDMQTFLGDLSEDGQTLCHAVLDDDNVRGKLTLSAYSRSLGWSGERFQTAFQEVKERLQ